MSSVTLVMAQQNSLVGDIQKNLEAVRAFIRQARERYAADLVIFPELNLSGYPPEDLLLRPGFNAWIDKALQSLKQEIRDVAVLVGHPALSGGKLYNAASLISDGEIRCQYFKHTLPNYSVFDEKRYFSQGNEAAVFAIGGINFGITICEDIWEPEPSRRAVAAGAEVIININASPYHQGKIDERFEIVRQRVLENDVPVIYLNMVGGQDELVFDGSSFVTDSRGTLCQACHAFSEELVPVSLKRDSTSGRIEPEPGEIVPRLPALAEVYQALLTGVRDFVRKTGFKGAIVGLSGGIDSALTLAIAADALGAENVEAVLMPSRYTADMSNEDAVAQARALQVRYHSISVEPIFTAFLESLAPVLDTYPPTPWDTTEENLQARTRGGTVDGALEPLRKNASDDRQQE